MSATADLAFASLADADHLFRARREDLVEVTEPLVLVSQVQRSGGTLMSSLFDGHPELHAHPWELQIGHPRKTNWPALTVPGDPDEWVDTLRQSWIEQVFHTVYVKSRERFAFDEGAPRLLLPPSFLDRMLRLLCHHDPPADARAVLDRYFTAFFNAWIDLQGLREGPKRWITAFCPRLAWGESGDAMWTDYPDGRLICIVRDPRGWLASALGHHARWRPSELAGALDPWLESTAETIRAKAARPDQVLVVTYERLVTDPQAAMAAVAEWLGIGWDPCLLAPTFNRRPVDPNSSFGVRGGAVHATTATRWRSELGEPERAAVERLCADEHARALAVADVA